LGAALAALNHLEDSPMVRRLQANVRVAAAQKGVLDTADPQKVPTLEADQSVLASDVVVSVPWTR
jgi:hypothetical protein